MEKQKIIFNFINPPFEENKKLFAKFLNKHNIVRGVDGIYHMSKDKKEYFNFLKKLHLFMKENDLLTDYERVFGIFENTEGEIHFKDFEEEVVEELT
jgi:hypothetical protein